MNLTNDGSSQEVRSRKSSASLRLAVAGLMLSAIVVGIGIIGTLVGQRGRDGLGKMAPSQSEPDPIAEREAIAQLDVAERHVKLVVHEDRIPDAEQLDDDLDELARAEAAAARGDWSAAARAYARITMDPPVPLQAWYHRAVACLKTGDQAGYREICESMLERVELDPFNLPPINLVAWMCAMAPDGVADHRRPVVLADLILPRLPDDPTMKHAYLNTIGGVYLRAGRYEEAVKHLKKGIATTADGGAKQDWLLLALAYHHLGRPADAKRALSKLPADSALNRRDSVWDRAEIEFLQDEVQRTISPR